MGTTGPEPRVTAWVWDRLGHKQGHSEIGLRIWALELPLPTLQGSELRQEVLGPPGWTAAPD